jgi:DNA (cytosine-5)-methyltransferase 1|nr:MAG TPA: Cytosine specific methyltransferase [Caudoviricetes sp.]
MQEVKVIGSFQSKFESTNRIYDVGGCSPTLSTMQGGNQEPKVIVEELGFMDNGTGKHQSNTVYNENGLSPSITTITGGGTQQIKICEQIPCKLNKMPERHLDSLDNAKICDVDTPTASTVTSWYYKGIGAHKDNMCIVAMRGRNPDNPSDRTTGSPTEQRLEVNMQGTSNCLTSVQKDNMVLESILAVDEQNMNVRKETFGTLTTDGSSPKHNNRGMIKQATKQGYAECELGGVADLSFPDSATRRGRVQECGNVCPTIMAQNQELCRIETQYRIRKLTPRECGRLMGVSDEDIEKMAAVNSNTQLYKQFGNSIVVDVMCAMFRNLNIEQE